MTDLKMKAEQDKREAIKSAVATYRAQKNGVLTEPWLAGAAAYNNKQPAGMDPGSPDDWFDGVEGKDFTGASVRGIRRGGGFTDPYIGKYTDDVNASAEDPPAEDANSLTQIKTQSTEVNYDFGVVHQTARYYCGRKEQFIPGDYVLSCGDVFIETGDVYSFGGGNAYNMGNAWEWNWGTKWEIQHGSTFEMSEGLTKLEFSFFAAEVEVDMAALNVDVSIGEEIGVRIGHTVNFSWEPGADFQLGDRYTVKWVPFEKEYTKESTDTAHWAIKALKAIFGTIFGAAHGELTIGDGWESQAVKVESFTDEQKQKFNDAVTEAIQQKVTAKKQELITEAEKAIKESAEEFVKQKKQYIQDEVKKAGNTKLTALKREVSALNLKLSGDITDLSANLLQIKKGTSGAGSVQADLSKATSQLLKAKKDLIKAQASIKAKALKIKALNQALKQVSKVAPPTSV